MPCERAGGGTLRMAGCEVNRDDYDDAREADRRLFGGHDHREISSNSIGDTVIGCLVTHAQRFPPRVSCQDHVSDKSGSHPWKRICEIMT
jgi:hypothetical protein